MQLSTCLSVVLACIVAAAAMPLGLEVVRDDLDTSLDTPPPSKKQKDGMKIVNEQLPRMQQTLTDAENGDVDARERVRLAFGPKGVDQIPIIRQKVQTIEAGTLKVSSLVPAAVDKKQGTPEFPHINAITPFNLRGSEAEELKTEPVEFGKNFYAKEVKAPEAASILLHEATHQIVHASDDSYKAKDDGTAPKMVPLGITTPKNQIEQLKGYANETPVLNGVGHPIIETSMTDSFRELRDSATDMHNNADSYALFGAICDVPRQLKRALLDDDPVAYYLAKRAAASCKLPPDYFKKKAAAQAAKKQAASMSSPASKSEVAKATNKNAAGVKSGSQKTTKGGKPRAVNQSALMRLGKATKSRRPNTSKSGLSKGSLMGSKARVPTSRGRLSTSRASRLSKASKGALKGSKARVPTSRGRSSNSGTSRLSSKGSKDALRGSTARVPTSRGRPSNPRTSRLSSKGSKDALRGSTARVPTSRGRPSNPRTSRLSSKGSKGALKGSMSETSRVKTSKSLSKSSESTRTKSVKANGTKGSSTKAVESKGSKSRSQVSRGRQTSKQLSTPRGTNASNSRSSKMTSATRKAAGVRPNAARTKASTPVQKATASRAPNVAKALSKSAIDPLKVASRPRKNGKP